nr:MAG TPA: hypothetical protein [Bacteriophage sp.]
MYCHCVAVSHTPANTLIFFTVCILVVFKLLL